MPASVPAPVRVEQGPAATRPALVASTGTVSLPLRVLRGLLLAALAAAVVLAGRQTGLLDGAAGLVFGAVLVVAVPTSRDLARRVLLAGCLLLGWTQVLWWWALPVGDIGRVTLGMLGLAAALGAWVGTAARPGVRARRLLPRLRPVDAVLPATAAFGAVLLQPWLAAANATQTLGVLMGGWDNVAHFAMVHTIRRVGRTVDLVGPGTGAAAADWQFLGYPEGFHAVAATVVEVLIGPSGTGIDAELPAYARALALVVIASTVVVVAGLCALPALRRRVWLAVPGAAFVAAVFFLGPGALAVDGGIGNFAVACALAVAVVLLVVPGGRVVTPLTLAAVGGAVVGIASSWVLMLALALPALPLLLLPLRRRRWAASEPHAALSIVLVLLVVGALVRTALVLTKVQAASPLTIDGGRVPIDLGVTVAAALAVLGACALVLGHGARRGLRTRVGALAAVPVAAAAVATALAVLQVRANGEVTYYGLKFLVGAEIVLLCVLVVPLVHLVDHRRRPRRRGAALSAATASVLAALALTQVFGSSVSPLAEIGLGVEAQGARNAVHQLQVIADPPAAADLVARVARTNWRPPPAGAYYLEVPSDRRVSPILVAQWFLALTDTWTSASNTVAAATVVDGLPQVAALAQRLLVQHPGAVVVVRPAYVDPVRRALDEPALGARVVGL